MKIHFTSKTKVHFTPKAKVHFMGVGGSGMAGISFLASKMGYGVTGCDLETGGHDAKHLKNIDLLVVTPAVFYQSAKHPELVEGQKKGIVITWQEFLGKYLHKGKKVICVAGTHGKSTTTAMVGKLLEDAGLNPLVNLGANYRNWNGGARFGKGNYFVTEADEFFDNFLNYHPEIIILNNVEFDHPDYFKSEKQIFESYKKFIGNLVGEKVLIVNWDDVGVRKLLEDIKASDAKILRYSAKTQKLGFNLRVLGNHNIANALGVVTLGKYLKIKDEVIKKSLESFGGIGRRMELISNANGVKIYDDYAHHPTAIKTTLEGLRKRYPKKRILAIIEPHGFKRTKALLPKYKGVFDAADKVIIGPIFKARDSETFGMTPEIIAKISEHPNIQAMHDINEIIGNWKLEIGNYDAVVVMGAGKSYLWAKEICNLKI